MRTFLLTGCFLLIFGSLTVFGAKKGEILPPDGKNLYRIHPCYGKHPARLDADGKKVYKIYSGTIGKTSCFKVAPGMRIAVQFRAKNANKALTVEGNPHWEGLLSIRGYKKVKLPSNFPVASIVFYNAAGKRIRMAGHFINFFQSVYFSQWKDYRMEFYVPPSYTGMEVWFSGGGPKNELLLSHYSVKEVKNAPTININPELKIENHTILGIQRYINCCFGETDDGRAQLSFRQGNIVTARMPVKGGTFLHVKAETLKNSSGCRLFVNFLDEKGKKCGSLRDHVKIHGQNATSMETVIGAPKNAVSFYVMVRFGTLTALYINETKQP